MRNVLLVLGILIVAAVGYYLVSHAGGLFQDDVQAALAAETHEARVVALKELSADRVEAMAERFLAPDTEMAHRRALAEVLMDRHGRQRLIHDALDSDAVGARRIAAYLLAVRHQKLGENRVFEVLSEWARDRTSPHHQLCVGALRERFPKRSLEPLVALLEGSPSTGARVQAGAVLLVTARRGAIPAAARDEVRSRLAAVARASDDDAAPIVRARAFQVFTALGGRDPELFASLASHRESVVRQILAHTLKEWSRSEAEPFLRRFLVDRTSEVRRAAVTALGEIGTPELITEFAPRLREDSGAVVRREISRVIQDRAVDTDGAIRVLALGLLDPEPDPSHSVWKASLLALHRLTGEHHGFPKEMFDSTRPAAEQYDADQRAWEAWAAMSEAERRAAIQPWFDAHGEPERRPVLLTQLEHADPECAAWAILELARLDPEAPTPGIDGALVARALENRHTMQEPFGALARAVLAHRDDGKWAEHVAAWKKAYR